MWNACGCASWYIDRNGRNTTLWPDFAWRFGARTREFVAGDHMTEPLRHPAHEPSAPPMPVAAA